MLNGELILAETVHKVTLANINEEFGKIVNTKDMIT